MPRSYPALDIQFHSAASAGALRARVLACLDDLQPTAIDDFGDEHGSRWRVFFSTADTRDAAAHTLATAFNVRASHASPLQTAGTRDAGVAPDLELGSVDVPDDAWAERSQAALGAVQVGRILVAPPWDRPENVDPTHIVVTIHPSMGFGTGHHASTRLCLTALQTLTLDGAVVLDVGTGSGVLAIAAARLGARAAIGIDTDPDALVSARENVALNNVGPIVTLRNADVREAGEVAADVVVANLTAALLQQTAHWLIRSLRPGGHLIVSGFGESYEPGVLETFSPHARTLRRDEEDGWICLTFKSTQTSDHETLRPLM